MITKEEIRKVIVNHWNISDDDFDNYLCYQ